MVAISIGYLLEKVRRLCVSPSMPSKRFNMWMEDELLTRIKVAAKLLGLKAAPYIRVAVLEKLGDDTCAHRSQIAGPQKKTKS